MDIDDMLRDKVDETRNRRREGAVEQIKELADGVFQDLHPVHKARAYRELQGYANDKARQQETFNDEHGVPE